jgi:hypothetical protein
VLFGDELREPLFSLFAVRSSEADSLVAVKDDPDRTIAGRLLAIESGAVAPIRHCPLMSAIAAGVKSFPAMRPSASLPRAASRLKPDALTPPLTES